MRKTNFTMSYFFPNFSKDLDIIKKTCKVSLFIVSAVFPNINLTVSPMSSER